MYRYGSSGLHRLRGLAGLALTASLPVAIRAEGLKLDKRFDLGENILFRGENRDIIIEPQLGGAAQRAEGEAVVFGLRGYYGPAGLEHRRDKLIKLL